jgi:catechol 2,3-dioxygenase-like lactoylglutathione lyase family enzyme
MAPKQQAATPEKYAKSVADFPGDERIHIALNVSEIHRSVEFYRHFFGVDPIKYREGYAKFDLQDPPLNISLNENPGDTTIQGHLGIQVKSTKVVQDMYENLRNSKFKIITEEGAECCYAVQDKLWVADPDGTRWEIFVTTNPESDQGCGADCICHQEFERTVLTAE